MHQRKALSVMIAALLGGALMSAAHAGPSLADFHGKAGGCVSCHGTNAVTPASVPDDERALNAACTNCHGGYDKLPKTGGAIDPHHSHLGAINCTSCHTAHAQPRLVCNDCHTFPNRMPFAEGAAAAPAKAAPDEAAVDAAAAAAPRETVDVVVIGAGSAGFNAAIAAKRAGASVLLLEKHAFSGGNSMLAAGGYNAAGTKHQKAKGIEDSVEAYVADTLKGGRGKNDPALVEILARESAAGVEWLEAMGADLSEVKRSGGARVSRTHRPAGGESVGPHIIHTLRAQAERDGVPARLNSRAVRLLFDADHRITGVVVEGKHSGLYRVNAKAVVLAAGGFGFNPDMVAVYRPTFRGMTSSNNVTSTGDGVKMALEAGASMTDIDWIQAHPTVGRGSRILISETVRGVGAVMVNERGARFVNELTTRDRASDAILHQPGRHAWLVFDSDLYDKAKMVRGYDHLGMLKKADTIEGLAEAAGMDPKVLAENISAYNAYRKAGRDEAFGRPDMPLAVARAPFYAVEVAPGIHHTMGGVAITTESEVLDIQSRPMPGLYAAGEVTGGVHGFNRLGGNAVADTVVFGRRAGERAAKYAIEHRDAAQ